DVRQVPHSFQNGGLVSERSQPTKVRRTDAVLGAPDHAQVFDLGQGWWRRGKNARRQPAQGIAPAGLLKHVEHVRYHLRTNETLAADEPVQEAFRLLGLSQLRKSL